MSNTQEAERLAVLLADSDWKYQTDAADMIRALVADRDTARQQLADAPHGSTCVHFAAVWQNIGEPCTCWKAGL